MLSLLTPGGVHSRSLPGGEVEVTSPPHLWISALDVMLDQMRESNFPFHSIKAVSVSAQQHGTVYWARGIDQRLERLDPKKPICDQLKEAFSFDDSPVWMDSSTSVECAEMEDYVKRG